MLFHQYIFENKDKLELFFIRAIIPLIACEYLNYIEIQFIKNDDNSNTDSNNINYNNSEYFPLEKYEEAIKAFKIKIETNGGLSSLDYTFEDIKIANDNIRKRIENVKK